MVLVVLCVRTWETDVAGLNSTYWTVARSGGMLGVENIAITNYFVVVVIIIIAFFFFSLFV